MNNDQLLTWILRGGLILSLLMMGLGSLCFLWQFGSNPIETILYQGTPNHFPKFQQFMSNLLDFNCYTLMQLGIIFLIITPFLRVLGCLYLFFLQQNTLYVVFCCFILTVLLGSLFGIII